MSIFDPFNWNIDKYGKWTMTTRNFVIVHRRQTYTHTLQTHIYLDTNRITTKNNTHTQHKTQIYLLMYRRRRRTDTTPELIYTDSLN